MAVLLDTSILGPLANTADGSYTVAAAAILELRRRGQSLNIGAQNLVEFRNFATRPHLMTFNTIHFRPLVALRPHIVLLDPATV